MVQNGEIVIVYIQSEDNPSDILTKNTRELTFVKHTGNIKGGTLLIDARNRENVIVHVVHGVKTYREVSVASTIRVEPDEEFVNAVVGRSHRRVILEGGNSPGLIKTTAQNVPRTSRHRRRSHKRGKPVQIIWDDTKSENGNFYQCGYCN
jgi:hypothetical protein